MTATRSDTLADLIGGPLSGVDTPAALLDLDLFENNASRLHRYLAEHGRTWRPHVKAHKSPELARRQLEVGAIGITCAKLSEAEVMVASGISEVLIANQLGTPAKWQRAAALQRDAHVIVCVDDPVHLQWAANAALAAGVTIPLFIEVDVGMRRAGVTSDQDAVDLAAATTAMPGIELAGLMGYEGHLPRVWPWAEKVSRCADALGSLISAARAVRAAGYPVDIVSSGGTGTFEATAELPLLTECQAGGGCMMDRFYAEECHVDLAPALTLLTTTISVRPAGRAVVDAGFKALGWLTGFSLPRVLSPAGVEVAALSAEHGMLALDDDALHVGDQVQLIPSYSDAMLFLHDYLIGHRQGLVADIIPLLARGRLT
jgi:D-serine deaminase-like pyridoxal phosphate-dependent protein